MKLIIDISEELYAKVPYLINKGSVFIGDVLDAVKNGTPLEEQPTDKCKGCYYNDGETHAECVVCNKEKQPKDADCISRQDAIKEFQSYREYNSNRTNNEWVDRIEDVLELLPPVTPQTVTEFADKCKECGNIKEDLYEKGFEAGKHYIIDKLCALLEKEGIDSYKAESEDKEWEL